MNLKNYEITVGEILKNPKARALFQKEFPQLASHPMLPLAHKVPLREVISCSRGLVPKEKVNEILSKLERI